VLLLWDDQLRPVEAEPDYDTTTDAEGGYRLTGIEPGLYDLVCRAAYHDPVFEHGVSLTPGAARRFDFTLEPLPAVDKPNLYLYPTRTMEISVTLGFPAGGGVTLSDPPYVGGWSAVVEPDGSFGSGYDYLFYEAAAPDVWQRERGWVVERENLEAFFRENLTTTGFYANEIADFVEWWLPRLETHPYYALYPQYNAGIAEAVELALSPEPHSLIRLYYVVEGLAEPVELPPATIPAFESGGFTVHEWGVVRDDDRLE
jgi:hypothetical protein